jgi:hypothetical protein
VSSLVTRGRQLLRRLDLGPDLAAALPPWLAARALVGVAWVLVTVIVDELGTADPHQLDEGLAAWDGTFYRDIGDDGYAALPEEALRFYPLFPLLGRGASVLFLGDVTLGLVLVANVAAFAAAAAIHRLVVRETGDAVLARRAVWMFCLFPGAFVLVWAYSEALMILLAVLTFLALRGGRFGLAAVAGGLAALTRPLGLLLVVPAAIEAARGWSTASRRERAERVGAVVAPGVGTALYLGWAGARFDDPLLPLEVQSRFRGDGVDPISRIGSGIGDLLGPEALGDGLHLPFALVFVALAVVVARSWPASYGAFTVAVLVVSLAAENLNSLERYGLNAFPLALGLAVVTSREWVERSAIAVGAAGVTALAALAWVGAYVP